jgi:AbrB family looped-hinge helix DNA binding protein
MNTVTVSPKFQVVIPTEVREAMGIVAGQRVQVMVHRDHIELVPLRPMRSLRGRLPGLDTTVPREKDRV